MIQTIYPGCGDRTSLVPRSRRRERHWERADAVRELVRGRMEVTGPITAEALKDFFRLPFLKFKTALFALGDGGFYLRGKFHPVLRSSNGVTGGCWRAFTDSPLIDCVRRFSLFQSKSISVSCWPGKKWTGNIAPSVFAASKVSWSCWTDASCQQPPGSPKCSRFA